MEIKSILVTSLVPMDDHAANRGEKLLGNASSIKRRPDGKVYISGQMQRHVLFSAIERLNDENGGDTYVSNGDGVSTNITNDLRSDLGGFLDTNKGDYSGRRTAPFTATPAVAKETSSVGRDLLVRLKTQSNEGDTKKQALATNEFSQQDLMVMNFHLDVGAVGLTKEFRYENEYHVSTTYKSHISPEEKKRRVNLFLEATRNMNDYANQARHAVSGEPQQVLIVLDNRHSRKAMRYFAATTSETERKNIIKELKNRRALYFVGDDTGKISDKSVDDAYNEALKVLEKSDLYTPAKAE